jgi:hypothetical protein
MEMRKIVGVEWITLDGVVQAPGHPDEDRHGGFEHGGWHLRYFDDTSRDWVVEGYAEAGGFPVRASHLREPSGLLATCLRGRTRHRRAAE